MNKFNTIVITDDACTSDRQQAPNRRWTAVIATCVGVAGTSRTTATDALAQAVLIVRSHRRAFRHCGCPSDGSRGVDAPQHRPRLGARGRHHGNPRRCFDSWRLGDDPRRRDRGIRPRPGDVRPVFDQCTGNRDQRHIGILADWLNHASNSWSEIRGFATE